MAFFWSRLADISHRSITLVLMGLTVVGLTMVTQGGYGVLQRKKERKKRKALEQAASNATQTQQV